VVVALVAPAQDSGEWRQWADVGQSFGVFSTVLSGMAFVALVITLWVQLKELSFQRDELRSQRLVAERSGDELRRSADAGMRMLHFELLKMSIDDPVLARVWPESSAGGDPEERRQLVYANLVFQHASLSMLMAGYTDEQVRESLRYLFASEIMRTYWVGAAAVRRRTQQPGSDHWRIAQIGDEVCREFESPTADPLGADSLGADSLGADSLGADSLGADSLGASPRDDGASDQP
jgi:hypothetical protein